jgi:hypothetical protein
MVEYIYVDVNTSESVTMVCEMYLIDTLERTHEGLAEWLEGRIVTREIAR